MPHDNVSFYDLVVLEHQSNHNDGVFVRYIDPISKNVLVIRPFLNCNCHFVLVIYLKDISRQNKLLNKINTF